MKIKVVLLAAMLLPVLAAAQSPDEQIAQEIVRLKKVMAALPENDDTKAMRPVLGGALDRAAQSLQVGRRLHALDIMTQAAPILGALQFREQPRFAQADLKQFESDWQAAEKDLAANERRYREGGWGKTPVAVRAMAEASWSRVRVLYDAADAYAKVTAPAMGYHYLGEARASLDWALFLRGLRFADSGAQPQLRSVAGEIAELERQIGERYKPPLSVDKHPQFIRLNATVKQAIELDHEGLYAGALYVYLRALRMFGQIVGEAPEQAALREQVAAAQKKAAGHEIARIFTEAADAAVGLSDPEESKAARAVVERVVPAYFAALEKPAAAPVQAGQVKITLVRWPYT